MIVELDNYFTSKGLSDADAQAVAAHFTERKVPRSEVLETEGKVCKHFYYVKQGILRLYEIDNRGNDVTGYFALEGTLMTALPSFVLQKPSRDFFVALEPSVIGVIGRDTFFELIRQYPAFAGLYNRLMEFAFIHSQMRIYSFLGMQGMEKLQWVMEHEPKLLQRVSSKAVASYLGMTNSTLSKLRSKLDKGLS
jgi:CRP-like cAMP-binding protein